MTNRELSPEAAKMFKKLQKEWRIADEAGKFLLTRAMEAWDDLREAQQILRREGVTMKDRFGCPKLHPATVREREARAGMLACLKSLSLDLASLESEDDATET